MGPGQPTCSPGGVYALSLGRRWEELPRAAVMSQPGPLCCLRAPATIEDGDRTVRDLQWGILRSLGVGVSGFGDATKPIDMANWSDAVAS